MRILAINSGSSTIKFSVLNMDAGQILQSGSLVLPTEDDGYLLCLGQSDETARHFSATEHDDSFSLLCQELDKLQVFAAAGSPDAIVHRVVHGGARFSGPVVITADVRAELDATTHLAPLHNPACLRGIDALSRRYPDSLQVAVFDTAFFAGLPEVAQHYALPMELCARHAIRRYGFHGISHQDVANQAARYLGSAENELRLVSLHLGSGASAAAIRAGKAIDTSMGMTPLEGLMMGTRSGDLDPGVVLLLAREAGMDIDSIEHLLNHDSGFKGLCGSQDMREIQRRAGAGDSQARFAIELFCHRAAKYVGAYVVALGGLDCLTFTAGIGEHDADIRERICERLRVLGVRLDQAANRHDGSELRDIAADDSQVRVLVVPANEELAMAHQALALLEQNTAGLS